jgi:DNA excision repair protein ERCC-2
MNEISPKNSSNVDSTCHSMTASWLKEEDKCEYYESAFDTHLPSGIYTLEDLKEFGIKKKVCPYFLARKAFEVFSISLSLSSVCQYYRL